MLRISIATIFLAVAPTQALAEKTLAAAGSTAGLFISRDRGVTWEKNAELGDTPIRAVVIERSNLNRLYAATTDALLISDDGGTSWSRGDFPEPANVSRLIAGGPGEVFALSGRDVWASSDGGRHWIPQGVPAAVADLAVDASVPPALYALTAEGVYIKSGGTAWVLLRGLTKASRIMADPDVAGKVFRGAGAVFEQTADGGATWTKLSEIPARTAGDAVGFLWSGDFEPEITITVLALVAGEAGSDVIALADVCITWSDLVFPCSKGMVSFRKGQWRTLRLDELMRPVAMAADRAANLVLAGGAPGTGPGLYRSTLAGVNWTGVSGFERVTVNTIGIATIDPEPWSQVFAGTSDGLFSSADRGETWQNVAALGKSSVFGIGVDPGGSGLVLASTVDGLFRSTDAGASWEKAELPAGVWANTIVVDPKKDGRAYLVDRNVSRNIRLRLWTSEDRGRSWYLVTGQPDHLFDVVLDSRTTPSTVIVSGGFGVQKSTDEALTWTLAPGYRSSRLLRLGEPAGTIYADGKNGLWKSANHGGTWEFMGPSIRSVAPPQGRGQLWDEWMELDALAIGSGRNETLIAGCVTYSAEYIFSNLSWEEVTIPGAFVLDEEGWRVQATPRSCMTAAVDPKSAGLIYVGGWGLQRSLDGGRSWLPVLDFAASLVHSIALGPSRKPSM